MGPKLYGIMASPPVRAVLMTAKALNLEMELIIVDMMNNENHSPEYLKKNPQHTIPTLDDDGFYLADSHAIMAYLVEKYGNDDSLYPKDLKKRAMVDSRLYFECGTLFAKVIPISRSILFEGVKEITQNAVNTLNDIYGIIEAFLQKNKWIAGDQLTVADLSVITTLTSGNILVPIDAKKFPKTEAYIKKMKTLPYYNINEDGLEEARIIFKSKLSA